MTAAKTSLMPEGVDRVLGKERMRDLMTFLLTEPQHLLFEGALVDPHQAQRGERQRQQPHGRQRQGEAAEETEAEPWELQSNLGKR